MIYAASIVFTFFFLMYQRYQFRDMKYERNTKWKFWAWCMKAEIIAISYYAHLFPPSWQDCLLSGVLMWVLFELGYNKIVLIGSNLFYVGQSSKQDNGLKKWKWLVMGICLIVSIIIKWLSR